MPKEQQDEYALQNATSPSDLQTTRNLQALSKTYLRRNPRSRRNQQQSHQTHVKKTNCSAAKHHKLYTKRCTLSTTLEESHRSNDPRDITKQQVPPRISTQQSNLCDVESCRTRSPHQTRRRIRRTKILPDEQYGFRKTHSTELQVARLVEFAAEAINERKSTGAIFLDISKAFDRVWHEGLIYKLQQYQLSTKLTKLIYSHIQHRKIRVRVNNALSNEIQLEAGVPQGSVLSPTS